MPVVVPAVSPHDQMVVRNLFELYLYDFSTIEPQPIRADGRYSSPEMLDPYWEDPQRYPFVIRLDDAPVGFALAKRGSALAGDLEAMDLAEFFVLRSYRRSGVGRRAASLVWDTFPGRWVVRVLAVNQPALAFWEASVAAYSHGRYVRDSVQQQGAAPRDWVIFRFGHLPGQ
jgi:predicted acetyltransferase